MFGYNGNVGAQLSHARTMNQFYHDSYKRQKPLRDAVETCSAKIAAQILAEPEKINTWLNTAITKHRTLTEWNPFRYFSKQRANTLSTQIQDAKATLKEKLAALQVAIQDGNEDDGSFKTILFHSLLQTYLTAAEKKTLESNLRQAYSYKPYGTFMEMVIKNVNVSLANVNNKATI